MLERGKSITRISSINSSGLRRDCRNRCSRSFAIYSSHWCRHFLANSCDKLRRVSFWFLSFWGVTWRLSQQMRRQTRGSKFRGLCLSMMRLKLLLCLIWLAIMTTYGFHIVVWTVGYRPLSDYAKMCWNLELLFCGTAWPDLAKCDNS